MDDGGSGAAVGAQCSRSPPMVALDVERSCTRSLAPRSATCGVRGDGAHAAARGSACFDLHRASSCAFATAVARRSSCSAADVLCSILAPCCCRCCRSLVSRVVCRARVLTWHDHGSSCDDFLLLLAGRWGGRRACSSGRVQWAAACGCGGRRRDASVERAHAAQSAGAGGRRHVASARGSNEQHRGHADSGPSAERRDESDR